MKPLLLIILICLPLTTFVQDATQASPPEEGGSVGLPDPSAVYCEKLGYTLGKNGVVIFPDGTECSTWAFFRGECGQKWSYCEQQGYKVENRIEDIGWIASYAVCVFPDGSECLEQYFFDGKCGPGEFKKWKMSDLKE